ncbi:hypothetical protein Tfont_01126 [Tepidimonas fonticaldi]|uniref:Ribbon-helix-helix protein CopG domain-containing protein n=2 Tax=Tepidimonas fonticaldi TaxID=1101373 RepID=A0A554XN24_9BURK|nr:hypothetical protein Tfont_01126 [Tepidimonas fonticaldi]
MSWLTAAHNICTCYMLLGVGAMHFNIYLDDATGQKLNAMAQQVGESRNALIRRAVSEWLAHQSQPQWPQAVLDFTGMADAPRFEAGRDRLKPPVDDPLA